MLGHLYVGLSRQIVLHRQLDIVANNIANADTSGFKVEDMMVGTQVAPRANTLDGPKGIKFAVDQGVARNFTQGPMRETGATLDVAIDGEGFFAVRTAAGDRYTRDGRFTLNAEGRLTTQNGQSVLDASGGEISVDPQNGPVSISKDGLITQSDPTSGQQSTVGKLGVVRFANQSALSKEGDNLFANVSNLQPQPATDAQVRQGMLEGSNVNPVLQITRMIEINRAYDAVSKMVDQTASLSSRSVERLGRAS